MKRLSLIMLIALLAFAPLYAQSSPRSYEFVMTSEVAPGSGTEDSIDDIPGVIVNGIRIYLGYMEGAYNSALKISDCKSLNNGSSPAELSIVKTDDEDSLEDVVTIYVAADSNVGKTSEVSIRFNTGDGWVYQGENAANVSTVEIVSAISPADVTSTESNVTASAEDQMLTLTARVGGPLKENAAVVGYNELTWPNDGNIAAGTYTATVSVEVVTGV